MIRAVKNEAIPKVKVNENTLRILTKAWKKARDHKSPDYTLSAWVRDACRERACRDLGKTQRQLFPWLF